MLPRANFKAKGEEFVKKLREQQIKLYSIDAPALVNVIASGEIAASPAIFESHTVLAASKGRGAGVGANGFGSEQRRQRGDRLETTVSPCRGLDGGSALGFGRAEGSGKILLW
jgi:hypothetical protein